MGITSDWFETNFMVANPSKFKIMFLGLHQTHKLCLETNKQIIPLSDTVELLGIGHDSKLKFDSDVKTMCAQTNRKVSAFSRVGNFITFEQAKLLYSSFIMSGFESSSGKCFAKIFSVERKIMTGLTQPRSGFKRNWGSGAEPQKNLPF